MPCDVPRCSGQTYLGWCPLTERMGRKICEQHWLRPRDDHDSFDLFEAFGFRRPAGVPKPVVKKDIASCASGRKREPRPVKDKVSGCRDCEQPREPGHRYCEKCGQKRKAHSNRKRQHRHYSKSSSVRAQKPNAFARPLSQGRILGDRRHNHAWRASPQVLWGFCGTTVRGQKDSGFF